MMKTIRWGIIGCGNVAEVKSGPGFQMARGSELVAVMRRNGELARDYARRHNVPRWYDDAEALIHDPGVDAIYIATPPSSHLDHTLAAARAGKPVYVEKPMARSSAECRRMIEACEEARVPLFVAYYRRALPRFRSVQSWIREGRIGEVRSVIVRFLRKPSPEDEQGIQQWRIDPEVAGCGYFCDLGSHMIDLLQFLLGPITRAVGAATNQGGLYEVEDVVNASFGFESGVQGAGVWSFADVEDLDRTEIIGSGGSITYATFGNSPVRIDAAGAVTEYDLPNPVHIQQPMIQTVVDQLLGLGKCESTGLTGATTNWVIDRILGRP
jgi:1,5-anhydro-D-fructose reductase (1,5-anhydro-D-mannitol-forming)